MRNKRKVKESLFYERTGKIIRANRERAGVQTQEAADYLKISRQQYYKYESGNDSISAYKVYRLSKLFKIDIKSIFLHINS